MRVSQPDRPSRSVSCRLRIRLHRGIPLDDLAVVLWNALSFGIHDAELELSCGIAPLGERLELTILGAA